MSLGPNVREYIDQYVKTATKGKVVVEHSLFQNRMKLWCKECDQSLTVPHPKSADEVDYGMQEFIKLHAHTGNHCAHDWQWWVQDQTFHCSKCKKVWDSGNIAGPKPVTLDFKPVTSTSNSSNLTATAIEIQQKEAQKKIEQDAIKAQMAKYDAELKLKMLSLENKGKIAGLNESIKAVEQAQKQTDLSEAATKELLLKLKEEQQMLQNILKLQQLQDENAILAGIASGHHASPPPPPTAKPLKQATGRKFR